MFTNLGRSTVYMLIILLCLLALVLIRPYLGSAVSQIEVNSSAGQTQQTMAQKDTFSINGKTYPSSAVGGFDFSRFVVTQEELSWSLVSLDTAFQDSALLAAGTIRPVTISSGGMTFTAEILRADQCGPDPDNGFLRGFLFRWGEYEACFNQFDTPEELIRDFLDWLGFRGP